jgi:hypothetical protein
VVVTRTGKIAISPGRRRLQQTLRTTRDDETYDQAEDKTV